MMKKVNDKKLYLYFGIVTFTLTVIFASIAIHSHFIEKKVDSLLTAKGEVDKNLKEAYRILREPHIFGGYDNFSDQDIRIKQQLKTFDADILSGNKLESNHQMYMRILLNRRKLANTLTINSMVFTLILTIISFIMFFIERRQND